MNSFSAQLAAKHLEKTILGLEDFFVDPVVDFLYHKGIIKHEDALDVYDYDEEREKFSGLLAILNRSYPFDDVLQHLESAMVILEQNSAAEQLAKCRKIYNSANGHHDPATSQSIGTISRWRRTNQTKTAYLRNETEQSQTFLKGQNFNYERTEKYSKVSKIDQNSGHKQQLQQQQQPKLRQQQLQQQQQPKFQAQSNQQQQRLQERETDPEDDDDIYQNLTFPKRYHSNLNGTAEKFGTVSKWRNSSGNAMAFAANKWLDFRSPKSLPKSQGNGTLEKVQEEDPDQANIYEDLNEIRENGPGPAIESKSENSKLLANRKVSQEAPIYDNVPNVEEEENSRSNSSSTVTKVSKPSKRIEQTNDQTAFLSGGNLGVAVKVISRRSSQGWPWQKRHEKQAVDNCFHSIEQLKCVEDLKLHGDHGNASGECGLCRSVSRTLFEKISKHNWQCPPETEIYVATGFFDPESFQFQPPNLIHLKLTAGGMELLDVAIYAFYPAALSPIIPIEISSESSTAVWDSKKTPNTICGLQLVWGSHLYIKTAGVHQRASCIDNQLTWPWEFVPKQPTIMDDCMKEIYQKSMLETLLVPTSAEKFAECLLKYVSGADQNAVWCLMRARGQQPFINVPKDSTLVFHCEVQAENFYILHFSNISELKSLSEKAKLAIYKQLKETYKMPKEAAIYRLKIFLKQNGLEKWNFAVGNAIRMVYLPLNAKQFFVETSYKLTNILLWQKIGCDENEKEQVEHL